jgi:hypothetical protein
VARRARPLSIENLSEDARFAERVARLVRGRAGSYLGVPLRLDRQVVGVLEVYTREPRPWRGDEVRLLLTFASQAAVAFQNARLADQSGRAARSAEVLQQLFRLAVSPEPPDAQAVVTTLGAGLGDGIIALRRDARSEGWQVCAAHGVPDDKLSSATPDLTAAARAGSAGAPDFALTFSTQGTDTALAILNNGLPVPADTRALLVSAADLLARERVP